MRNVSKMPDLWISKSPRRSCTSASGLKVFMSKMIEMLISIDKDLVETGRSFKECLSLVLEARISRMTIWFPDENERKEFAQKVLAEFQNNDYHIYFTAFKTPEGYAYR